MTVTTPTHPDAPEQGVGARRRCLTADMAGDPVGAAPAGAAPLIDAHGLTKRYGDFTLSGIDVTVNPGDIVGFIGQNGAGKTTTIKTLLGLVTPQSGTGTVLGTPLGQMSRQAGNAVKERIGVVLDTVGFPVAMRVDAISSLMPHCYADWDAPMFDRMLRESGIDGRKTVQSLSRGMGMKMSLAVALSHHPTLLILDEATAGLDPMARDDMLDLLRRFVDDGEHGILMSSHITSDLDRVADRVICIDGGRMVFDESKDTITDIRGIARCRERDLAAIASSGRYRPGELRAIRHDYGIDVAVPDRFAFAKHLPGIPVDRMTIDDYMHFMLKGGRLMVEEDRSAGKGDPR